MKSSLLLATVCLFAVSQLVGCAPAKPEIVPLTVIVKTAKGQPINNVQVKFVPQIEGLDGNAIAVGVTDDQGSCQPMLRGSEDPGCYACLHKIEVSEGPLPDDIRAAYTSDGGASGKAFQQSLKHRPIPKDYTRLNTTPLSYTPSADNSEPYGIVLE